MPDKYITYSVKTNGGKKIQVPADKIQQYANTGASIRMRNSKNEDFTISVDDFDAAQKNGYRPYRFEHTVVQPRQRTAAWMQEIIPQRKGAQAPAKPTSPTTQSPVPPMIARPKDYTKPGTFAKQLEEQEENSYAGIRRQQGLDEGKYNEADVQGVRDRMEQREIDRQRANAERIAQQAGDEQAQELANRPWYANFAPAYTGGVNPSTVAPPKSAAEIKTKAKQGAAFAALDKLSDAQEALGEDRKTGHTTWAGRAGRGLVNTAKKVKTWDMGVSDMSNNTALLEAATAYGNGTATEEQQALLDAAAFNTKVQDEHGDALTGMYGAGATTAQMIPFMAQMAMNPGTGIGKAAMNGVGKYVTKRLGKNLAEKFIGKVMIGAAKGAARFAGDTVEGAVANTVFGMPTTLADTADRMTGTIMPAKDENGHVVYSGQREGAETSSAKAFGKAAVANTLEYSTELAGEYFKPIGQLIGGTVSRGLKKVGLNSVNDWLTKLSNKQLVKSYQNFADQTKWSGTFGEYGEEVINNVENAATVGDMNFNSHDDPNSVFNIKTNLDTFLGVALTGGFMSAMKTGTYARNKYKIGKALGDADTKAAAFLGADTWKTTKTSIDDADDNNIVSVLTEHTKGKTPEQTRSIIRYAGMVYADRGANLAQMKDAAEGNAPSDIEQNYDKGRGLTDTNDMVDANNDFIQKREAAITALGGDENIDAVFANGASGAMLDRMKKSGAYTDDQIKAAEDYVNSKSVYDGMIDKVRDDIDTKVKASDAAVDSHIHKDDGMVHPATMMDDDRKVYIISGNVALSDNGDIDDFGSDDYVIVSDAETGEMEMLPPSFLKTADAPISADQEKQEAADNIRETVSQQASNTIEGVLPFNQGDTYNVTYPDGNPHTLQIISDTGDGNVQVSIDRVEQAVMPKQVIQQLANTSNLARLQEKQKASEAEETAAENSVENADVVETNTEQKPPRIYDMGDNSNVNLTLQDGENVTGRIVSAKDGDGAQDVELSNGSVIHATDDELNAMAVPEESAANVETVQNEEISPQLPQNNSNVPENNNSTEETPSEQKQPVSAIPVDKDGNSIYDQAPVEETIKDLYNGELDDNEVGGFIGANVDEAQKVYDKVQNKAPKMSTNKQEYLADKKAWQQDVAKAKRKLDYWNNVDNENKRITHTTDDEIKTQNDELSGETARKEARNAYGNELGNAQNADELAADFVRGAKITPESFRKETGLSTADQRKFVGMIASADKGGRSIERLGEDLVQYDNDNHNGSFFHGDSNAARSAIISALTGNAKKDMKIDADGRVEDFVKQREEERERFYNDAYHMTYEEYLDYNSAVMPELLRKYSNFDDKEYYDSNIDDILNQQNKEHGKGNDTTGEERGNAGGNQILPEQKPDKRPGVETSEDKPAETGTGMHGGNAERPVSQGAPGGGNTETPGGRTDIQGTGGTGVQEAHEKLNGQEADELMSLMETNAVSIITQMEETAEVAPEVELTIENWDNLFGGDGKVDTPIGKVKMGENQFTKLMRNGRNTKLGMIKPTLENPDVIIEDKSSAKNGDVAERNSSLVFVKTFKKADGSRYYYFTSVTVSKDNLEVVISNQEKRKSVLANLLVKGKLVWKHADDVSTASDMADGLYSSQGNMSDLATEGTDAPQTNVSDGKDKSNIPEKQEKEKESDEKLAEEQYKNELSDAEKAVRDAKKELNDSRAIIEFRETQIKMLNEKLTALNNGNPDPTYDNKGVVESTIKEYQKIIDDNRSKEQSLKQKLSDAEEKLKTLKDKSKQEKEEKNLPSVKIDDANEQETKRNTFSPFFSNGVVSNPDGAPMTLYHGTDNAGVKTIADLETGHTRDNGEQASFAGEGISFTSEIGASRDYGKNVLRANITLKNPYYTYGNLGLEKDEAKAFTAELKKRGYDGIINFPSKEMREVGAYPMEVVAFDKSQISEPADNSKSLNEIEKEYQESPEAANEKRMADIEQRVTEIGSRIMEIDDELNGDVDVFKQAELISEKASLENEQNDLGNEYNGLKDINKQSAEIQKRENTSTTGKVVKTDSQGNPINEDGSLMLEKVASVDDLTDDDFTKPTRSVELPTLPKNVDDAIGAEGKPVIIKKNIFEKNSSAHEFKPQESRHILMSALYNTDIVGQSQPHTRGNHWVAIKLDDKSPITILEVNENKDNVEVVGWYTLDARNLERIKRQVQREGGELLILTPKGAAASLSTLPQDSSSAGKDNKVSDTKQENREELDKKLVEERRQRILKEGTTFDASFGLKHPVEIKTVEDIDDNIGKIISGLAHNEGSGDFEGYAYGGKYVHNASEQIKGYLKELTGVLPKETLDEWAASHGFKTYGDVVKWAEDKYNQEKQSGSAEKNSTSTGNALARVDDMATALLAEDKNNDALYDMDSSTEEQRDKSLRNLIKRKMELRDMLSTLSDSEFDKVYDKYVTPSDGTDPVYGEVLRHKKERENEAAEKKRFEDGIAEQGKLPDTEAKPKKYSPYDSAGTDEMRPKMQGLYHGGGYGVTSDGLVLVADKKAYDKKQDGKIIGRDGKEIDGKYPNWQSVIPNNDQSVQGVAKLTKQLNAVEERIKEDWKAAKARGEKPWTLAKYTEYRTVAVKFPTGDIITFKYSTLRKFLNAANHIGATSIEYRKNSSNAVVARSKDGLCISNQMVNTPDSDYYVDLSKEKAGKVNSVRKQQGASMDDLTNDTEAKRAATDAIMQTLKDIGVDVTVLDDGAETPDNARRQEVAKRVGALKRAADTIKGWVAGNKRNKYFTIELPQATQRLVKNAMGRDFDSHNITANGIAHALKNHGENGDKLNEKSIAIRKEDTELIPYIMTAPDYVIKGSDDMGRESVRFYKTLSNGYVVVVEKEQKNSPDDMDTITMWAEKSTDVTDARNNTSPMYHAQDVIISTDAAKIIKDAETAMENDVKIQKQSVFRNSDGTIYGYTVGGKIYLYPKGINPNTPIHEYTHLWASFMKKANPKEWNNIKRLLKGTPVWDEVLSDKDYQDIKDNDDDVASEVLSRISGRKNSKRIVDEMQKGIDEAKANGDIFGMAEKISTLQRIKDALHRFWNWVGKDLFHIHFKSVDEVADRVLYDMVKGTKLDVNAETERIVSEAKADGTYMKAPNGKPTKLNEKQWAQVRTKNFKNWFGDWEKAARIEKLKGSKPIEITGKEIEPSDDLKQYKKNALEYGKKLRGEYTNKDTGEIISLTGGNSRGGIREILQHDYKDIEHLQSIAAIPQIIEDSTFIDTIENEDKKKYPGVDSFSYYVCGLKIGGTDYTVKAVIANQSNGERYYDHKLSEIEKGQLLSTIPTIQKAGEESNSPLSGFKDKRLISILQTNSSKVVDENGEPMVVYHGSSAKRKFYVFKDATSWVTPSETYASAFTRDGDKNGFTHSLYADIKNPVFVGDIDGIINNESLQRLSEHTGLSTDELSSMKGDGTNIFNITNSEDFRNAMIKHGYDGIEAREARGLHTFGSFYPNQIKSATGNNGDFSSTNDDIRYQFIGEKGAANADKAEEATTRLDNLGVARQMEAGKKDAKAIKMATGWERGADGKWRYETSDVEVNEYVVFSRKSNTKGDEYYTPSATLEDIIGKDNKLFNEYPQMRAMDVFIGTETNTLGFYDPSNNSINLSDMYFHESTRDFDNYIARLIHERKITYHDVSLFLDKLEDGSVVIPEPLSKYFNESKKYSDRYVLDEKSKSVLIHEIQHAIQEIEGFAKGGNPRMFKHDEKDAAVYAALKSIKHINENGTEAQKKAMNVILDNGMLSGSKETYDANSILRRSDNGRKLLEVLSKTIDYGVKIKDIKKYSFNPYDKYKHLGGEVEARNVQSRMGMTDEERRSSLAADTEDVSREDQIFIYDGVGESASFADNKSDFDTTQKRAVEEKGIVMSGLKTAEVKVVDVPKHDFTGDKPIAQAKEWAKDNLVGDGIITDSTGMEKTYHISNAAVDKYLNISSISKSDNLDTHLSVLKKLKDVISNSVEAEIHPDYTKNKDERGADNKINPDVLIHRFYGAANIGGKEYRVKTTIKEYKDNNKDVKPYTYEVTKIELLAGQNEDAVPMEASSRYSNNSITAAKLLQGVEKSYDKGKNLLDESEDLTNASDNNTRFRMDNEFADGETFPIHTVETYKDFDNETRSFDDTDNGTYSREYMERNRVPDDLYTIDGINDTFDSKESLLDAFRNKYEGYVATLSEDGKSIIVEPWSKYLKGGKSAGNVSTEEHTASKTNNAKAAVDDMAKKLNLDNVEVITDTSKLKGKKQRAKGWYDTGTGKITIVLPNHTSVSDVLRTILHEGVAHHGLRKMFGEHFDDFLDNVYNNVERPIRDKIAAMAAKNGWDFRTATEEYLGSLAEDTNFNNTTGWWGKIKQFFVRMLADAGIKLKNPLSDNDLRYVLWRSYQNLKHPGERNIFDKAEDITMQYGLKVGEYADDHVPNAGEKVAEPKPIGTGAFGDIYDQFKGKPQEAVAFLLKKRSGYLKGVFHRDGIGDIDLAWGTAPNDYNGKGLAHIIRKHLNKFKDFKSEEDMISTIKDVINNGNITLDNERNAEIKKDGNKVVIAKDENGNWVLTSYNEETPKKEKTSNSTIDTPAIDNGERAVSPDVSVGKDNKVSDTKQGNEDIFSMAERIANEYKEKERKEKGKVLFRDGEPETKDRTLARDAYEKKVSGNLWQFQEAMQDSMLGLKTLMNAIAKANGHKVADFENAYIAENLMSSANQAQATEYAWFKMKPLLDIVDKLKKYGESKEDVTDYMVAKHGLERNVVMAERDAQVAFDKYQKEHPNGQQTYNEFLDHYRHRDYSGLTALTKESNIEIAEAKAQQMVDDFQQKVGMDDIDELWEKVNDCTKTTLQKMFESGIIDNDTYEKTRDMFKYYIPLRGWDDKTSDEVYGYFTSKDGPMRGSIMKSAKGRKTKADDPLATISAMAERGIAEGNRNLMKQRFLNFVQNNPSDAVSVNSVWMEYDKAHDEWHPMFADLKPDDTAAEVEKKVADFEDRMEQLAEQEPERYKKGSDTVGVPYIVKKEDMREHQVLVKRRGKTYVLTINGNPRAAQALNGLTNPDTQASSAVDKVMKAGEYINRQLSAVYTTRNPGFVASNFIRDAMYANSMVWVKESPVYALRFHKNFLEYNPTIVGHLLWKYEHGSLNMDNETDKAFYDFMHNGGETGYTITKDIEGHKKEIKKELRKHTNMAAKGYYVLGERLNDVNRSVENTARFAAFLTSRQMGRSIDRSVYDAKEISVNFNKKGSGAKTMGMTGEKWLGSTAAFTSGIGRGCFVFWNAAVQGTFNIGKNVAKHPVKGLTFLASNFLLGMLISHIGSGGDGDDDEGGSYYDLPDFVRRSNICFKMFGKWVTIPLSVEQRAIYGMGELAYSVMSGNEKLTSGEIAVKISEQLSQCLPIDILEGDGGLMTAVPSWIKPAVEAGINKDWTGLPIYKDTPFNKSDPEWTKAYKNANKPLVDASRWLNEESGGNDYLEKGMGKINPSIVEHLLTGYFGGVASTINQFVNLGYDAAGKRDFDWRDVPVASRIIKNADERTQMKAVNDKYFHYKEEFEETKRLMRNYKKEADKGVFEYAEYLDKLNFSPEMRRYEVMEDYMKDITDMQNRIKETKTDGDDAYAKELQAEQDLLKKQMVDAIDVSDAQSGE